MADKVVDLRSRILASDDIDSEVVEVRQWDCKLEVRALNGRARARFLREFIDPETGQMDYEKMYPSLAIQTVFDPDSGEQVFTNEDVEALNAKSGAALEVIAQTAIRLSGLNPEAVDAAGKDSALSQKEGSISS